MIENIVWGVLIAVPLCWAVNLIVRSRDRKQADRIRSERFARTGKTRSQIMDEARANVFPSH